MKLNLRTTVRGRQKKWTEAARGCARIFFVKVSSGTHCLTGVPGCLHQHGCSYPTLTRSLENYIHIFPDSGPARLWLSLYLRN